MEPVEVSLHQETIIRTMIELGIYDTMMAQINRLKADPKTPSNAIACMEFADGKGTVRFIQYHFKPDDPGWLMATIPSADKFLVDVVRDGLAAGYTAPIKTLFIDSPQMRN